MPFDALFKRKRYSQKEEYRFESRVHYDSFYIFKYIENALLYYTSDNLFDKYIEHRFCNELRRDRLYIVL